MGGLWGGGGGAKDMLAPLSNYWGGPGFLKWGLLLKVGSCPNYDSSVKILSCPFLCSI